MPETQPYTIAEAIRERRSYIASRGTRYIESETDQQPVGRFLALGGAVVAVDIHAKFSSRWTRKLLGGEEQTVQFSAVAECSGLGCVDPRNEVPNAETFLLAADADETGKAPFLLVPDALKWAQAHAETCRAMPYPTA